MTNPIEMGKQAISFLVKSCPTFDIDDAGFIINLARTPPQRHVLKLDDRNKEEIGKEIVIYQDPIPNGDYFLLNPYAEGTGLRSPPLVFLYDALALTASHRVGIVMESLLTMLVQSKEDGKDKQVLPESALRIVSKHRVDGKAIVDLVDAKMVEEIRVILEALGSHYIVPAYVPAHMTSRLVVKCLTNPDFETSFGKTVRKKTVHVFLALTKGILDIDKPEDLTAFETKYDPDLRVPPKMHTFLSTLLKIYLRFNDALEEVVADPAARINLGELSEIIEQIPLVFPIARNAVISQSRSAGKVTDVRPLSRGMSAREELISGHRRESQVDDRDRDRGSDRSRDELIGTSRSRSDDRGRSRYDRDDRYDDRRDRDRYDDRRDSRYDRFDDDRDLDRFGQPRRRDRFDDRRDDDRGLERPRGGNFDSYRSRTRYR